jgi:hypothetical protein
MASSLIEPHLSVVEHDRSVIEPYVSVIGPYPSVMGLIRRLSSTFAGPAESTVESSGEKQLPCLGFRVSGLGIRVSGVGFGV